MKKLLYSPDYREKIIRLKNDLDIKYGQEVRRKVLAEIDHSIRLLRTRPHMGISLRAMYGFDCEFCYICVSPNLIFYEVGEDAIYILNMYHEKEDYMIKFLSKGYKLHEEAVPWTK